MMLMHRIEDSTVWQTIVWIFCCKFYRVHRMGKTRDMFFFLIAVFVWLFAGKIPSSANKRISDFSKWKIDGVKTLCPSAQHSRVKTTAPWAEVGQTFFRLKLPTLVRLKPAQVPCSFDISGQWRLRRHDKTTEIGGWVAWFYWNTNGFLPTKKSHDVFQQSSKQIYRREGTKWTSYLE